MIKALLILATSGLFSLSAAAPHDDCGPECYPLQWNEEYESTHPIQKQFGQGYKGDSSEEEDDEEAPDNVIFWLYTRQYPEMPDGLRVEDYKTDRLDPTKEVKILIHGWLSAYDSDFGKTITKAYLKKSDVNVISVDWYDESHAFYPTARSSVPAIGEIVAKFIKILHEEYKIDLSKIHLVGHSLGAHVAGIAGLRLQAWNVGTIDRITGLDPASPLFGKSEPDRLTNVSASFVDVIHTCGLSLGFFSPVGHVDFYPNKGLPIQPGCGLDIIGTCSHARSYFYFSESINHPSDFMGVPCENFSLWKRKKCTTDLVMMGENVPKDARGVFYLKTAERRPFGLGLRSIFF